MKPTNGRPVFRSMPLTSAMARFADVAELIRSRAEADETLHDLCDDYHLARLTLMRMKRQTPKPAAAVTEYSTLVHDLEDEIIRRLVGPERPPG
jgi:hypothetical protein